MNRPASEAHKEGREVVTLDNKTMSFSKSDPIPSDWYTAEGDIRNARFGTDVACWIEDGKRIVSGHVGKGECVISADGNGTMIFEPPIKLVWSYSLIAGEDQS